MSPDPELLAATVARLANAGCVAAEEEAALFVADAPDAPALEEWIARREQGEPVAWIVGRFTFGALTLRVAPGVYVPRFQSLELAERAAAVLPDSGVAVDLCTGAGAIAAHLRAADPSATVIGVDIDPTAAACSRSNGVPTVVGDLAEPLHASGTFDVVTAVAPYVPTDALRLLPTDVQRYEPRVALDGGPDGLDLVRRVIVAAARLLRPGGWLLVEVGGEHEQLLVEDLRRAGFEPTTPWLDDEGDLRGLAARLGPSDPRDGVPSSNP